MNQSNNRTSMSYQDYLIESLKDPEEAIAYLNVALEEGEDSFLMALHNVAKSWGFSNLADKTDLEGTDLYHMFSSNSNPKLKSLHSLLHSMGLRIIIKDEAA